MRGQQGCHAKGGGCPQIAAQWRRTGVGHVRSVLIVLVFHLEMYTRLGASSLVAR